MFFSDDEERIKTNLHAHKELLQMCEAMFTGLPEGYLVAKEIDNKKRYYHKYSPATKMGQGKQVYLARKDESVIIGLAQKRYINDILPEIKANIQAAEVFLSLYKALDPEVIIGNMPAAYHGIPINLPSITGKTASASAWAKENYEKNPFNQDGLLCRSLNGLMVRSKSEAIIVGLLDSYNIPYRYEACVNLHGNKFYPDFTILSPKRNQLMYWEHFGMMDNPEYANSMERKLRIYREYGIVQWMNLIVTFETKDIPLDAQTANDIIKAFLLPGNS